ncbi:hypothetical protein [Tritonibacter mobilis]|uniref:hypothetical protein n=1 Tax=Tritonibacter mobilis TaxID=379347 RepID=UPI000806CAB5|nr:hypothetical protein [Tritonibacter mobilis]GLP88533.1 hypothetical protein GCM10007921_40960 [Tritonibacter mobilis]SDX81970.1 hypothetical protein SAMN05444385_11433 [Tritonibacter mobilis]
MKLQPTRQAIVQYLLEHGLIEGQDYTIGGLRTNKARNDRSLIGIEEFNGFWRTYVAEEARKTGYEHWPSFLCAAKHIIEEYNG